MLRCRVRCLSSRGRSDGFVLGGESPAVRRRVRPGTRIVARRSGTAGRRLLRRVRRTVVSEIGPASEGLRKRRQGLMSYGGQGFRATVIVGQHRKRSTQT